MFDDPRRELDRLQRELLAEEEEYGDDDLADILSILEEDEPEADTFDYEEYWEDDDRMVYTDEDVADRAVCRDYGRRPKKQKKPKEKGIRGLVILACLELLGILGILGWWMVWLMGSL
jgi:hypothetical protein